MTKQDFNMVQSIVKFENGELEENEVVELFQWLLDSTYILNLQGTYHRFAKDLISQGLIEVR